MSTDRNAYDLVVVARVTNCCSLGCKFCGFSRELQRPPRHVDPHQLRSLGRGLQLYQRRSQRSVLVSWLGGEPFQWPDWRRMSAEFVQNFGLPLGVTTNGLALGNARIRSRALQLFRQITISIDGSAKQHDALRQQPGMHARLHDTVQQLVAERTADGPLLRVNTVLTRSNVETFDEFCELMATWGFDELTFNPLGGNDRPEFYPNNRLLPQQIDTLMERLPGLRQSCQGSGLQICGSAEYLQRLRATAIGERWFVPECNPGEAFLFVDEYGRLSPCSFTSGEFSTCLTPDSPPDIAALAGDLRRQRNLSCPAVCHDCHANHVYAKFRRVVHFPAQAPSLPDQLPQEQSI